eukprot:1937621-Amphidinium_carterae.1
MSRDKGLHNISAQRGIPCYNRPSRCPTKEIHIVPIQHVSRNQIGRASFDHCLNCWGVVCEDESALSTQLLTPCLLGNQHLTSSAYIRHVRYDCLHCKFEFQLRLSAFDFRPTPQPAMPCTFGRYRFKLKPGIKGKLPQAHSGNQRISLHARCFDTYLSEVLMYHHAMKLTGVSFREWLMWLALRSFNVLVGALLL